MVDMRHCSWGRRQAADFDAELLHKDFDVPGPNQYLTDQHAVPHRDHVLPDELREILYTATLAGQHESFYQTV